MPIVANDVAGCRCVTVWCGMRVRDIVSVSNVYSESLVRGKQNDCNASIGVNMTLAVWRMRPPPIVLDGGGLRSVSLVVLLLFPQTWNLP